MTCHPRSLHFTSDDWRDVRVPVASGSFPRLPRVKHLIANAFLALLACCVWPSAHALVGPVVASACYACTNAQFNQMAANLAASQRAGYFFLYNLQNGDFRKYHIEADPIPGGYNYYADEQTPSTSEQASWDAADQSIGNNHGSSTFISRVTTSGDQFPDPGITAFDVASTGAYVKDISDWLTTGYGKGSPIQGDIADTVNTVASIMSQIILNQNPLTITVIVTFQDGTQAYFYYAAGYVDWVLTKAYDKSNNPIPLTYSTIPNTYIFRNGDNGNGLGNFLNNHYGLGLSVPTCYNGTLACVRYGNDQVSCTWNHCDPTP